MRRNQVNSQKGDQNKILRSICSRKTEAFLQKFVLGENPQEYQLPDSLSFKRSFNRLEALLKKLEPKT